MKMLEFTLYNGQQMAFQADSIIRTEVSRVQKDWTKIFYYYYNEESRAPMETYITVQGIKEEIDKLWN